MQFRIGVNIGDVIYDEARIYGDGINIAARLESIAEPGGIYVSRQAYDQVEGKVALSFRSLGARSLKNIAKPVEVFAVEMADHSDKVLAPSPTDVRKWCSTTSHLSRFSLSTTCQAIPSKLTLPMALRKI